MNKRLEKAILESIQKHVDIRYNGGIDEGSDNCPLCEYDKKYGKDDCKVCPIFAITGLDGCSGTPYIDWKYHHIGIHHKDIKLVKGCKTCKKLNEKEIKFLSSLLPYEVEIVNG